MNRHSPVISNRLRPTTMSPPSRRLATFSLAIAVLALDQFLKEVIRRTLPAGGASVSPLFDFQRVRNAGVNFGLLSDYPQLVLVLTGTIGLVLLGYMIARPPRHWWTVTGFALLLGGGFSNVVDRIRLGWVFDYLNIYPFVGYLNLADLAIGAGVIVLVLEASFRKTMQ